MVGKQIKARSTNKRTTPNPTRPGWQLRLRRSLERMGRHAVRLISSLNRGDNKSAHAASDDSHQT